MDSRHIVERAFFGFKVERGDRREREKERERDRERVKKRMDI